jgi:hypothetical protein
MVVDPKRIKWKKWRAKEEERHKKSLTPKISLILYSLKCYILSLTYLKFNFNI